jgi:hypothetical protein
LLEKGKIAAITFYRQRKPGTGLAAAKEYVDRLEATVPPGTKARSRPAGCFGLVVLVGAVLLCAVWFLKSALGSGG